MTTANKVAAPPSPKHTSSVKLDRVVCKFGGSSLADSTRLKEVAKLVKMQIEKSDKMPIVVLSAMGKTTDELLQAGQRALVHGVVDTKTISDRAHDACKDLGLHESELGIDALLSKVEDLLEGVKRVGELSPRTRDYLVSFGERLSVRIFAAHMRTNENVSALHVDAFDAGFRTDSNLIDTELAEETFANVKKYFDAEVKSDQLAIVTGFIAKDKTGRITTLGRGGSDLTASVLGAALGTTEVQVWKDVDGILSTDPRLVDRAVPIPILSFEEAAEMAFFGAKVLHPSAVQPALKRNIPVRVKNSYNPDHPGTVIVRSRKFGSNPVTAVSIKKDVQVVDIVSTRMLGASGFLGEVFKAFAHHRISIDVVATSEVSISMTLDKSVCDRELLGRLKDELSSIATVSISESKNAIVSLIADSSRSTNVASRALTALDRAGINVFMISQGAGKFNVSLIVDGNDAQRTVREIHDEFFS